MGSQVRHIPVFLSTGSLEKTKELTVEAEGVGRGHPAICEEESTPVAR